MSYVAGDLLMGKSPNYADLAAKSEKQRQALIDLGMKEINAVFQGGTAPFYSVASGGFNPTKSYFDFGDKGFNEYYSPGKGGHGLSPSGANTYPSAGSMLGKAGKGAFIGGFMEPGIGPIVGGLIGSGIFKRGNDPLESAQERIGKGLLYEQNDRSFKGFGPDFYNQRAQAYVDYAMPQLAKQYRDTRDVIGFGLANRGLRGSGTARQQYSNLARTNQEAVQGISDTGRTQAQALQRQVEDERNTLINQLYQSADPARGVQSAISAASNFAQPSVFAPLANTFSGLINQYYTSQLLNPNLGGYSPSMFGSPGLNTAALPSNYSVG